MKFFNFLDVGEVKNISHEQSLINNMFGKPEKTSTLFSFLEAWNSEE
jgi:hypothetical protein